MSVFEKIAEYGIVAVVSIDDVNDALPLADALMSGGLPVVEVTLRTKVATQAIEHIARYRPEMLVGAGTVLTETQVNEVKDAGAQFALSPGIDRAVLECATSLNLPFAPGIATPSDLQLALRFGCQMVKFFPAMASGGPQMLRAISGPYLHTGIRFNPTGGVNPANIEDWFSIASVSAVGGTWIADNAAIASKNWDAIAKNAAEAVAKASTIQRRSTASENAKYGETENAN